MNTKLINLLEVATPHHFSPANTLAFAKRQAGSLKAHKGSRIVCVEGKFWITRAKDAADYFIGAGQAFPLDADLTVSALSPATLRLERA